MQESFKFLSRGGKERLVEYIDSNTVRISGDSPIVRHAYFENSGKLQSIDFEGGPFLEVGMDIKGVLIDEIIKDNENNCYILKAKNLNG